MSTATEFVKFLFGKSNGIGGKDAAPVSSGTDNEGDKKKYKGQKVHNIQDMLQFIKIDKNGIIKGYGCYSKLYEISDANFDMQPEDRQQSIIDQFITLINKFPDNVDISIIIRNRRETHANLAENYHIPLKNDELDIYRQEYNNIIDESLYDKDSMNDIIKAKYLLLTVRTNKTADAKMTLGAADGILNESLKPINNFGARPLNAVERLEFIREVLCGVEQQNFKKKFKQYIETTVDDANNEHYTLNLDKLRDAGKSSKDTVCPEVIEKLPNNILRLGEDRYCRSYMYTDLPPNMNTSFLSKTTNLAYEMVTVMQLRTVPHKKAAYIAKTANTSIKADKIKALQAAYRAGYDGSVANENLEHATEEVAKLYEDVMFLGKRLYFATMVVTMFGKSIDELADVEMLYKSACQDFSVNPTLLRGEQIQGLNTAICVGDSQVFVDRMLTSDNCACLFPYSIQDINDKNGRFYGRNQISRAMILYNRRNSELANGTVFGQAGSGKSYISKGEIVPTILDSDDNIIIIDPEDEYRVLTRKFNGNVVDLRIGAKMHINPLDLAIEYDKDVSIKQIVAEKCDFVCGIIDSINGRGRELNSAEVSSVHKVLTKLYQPYIKHMKELYNTNSSITIDYDACPTLKDFHKGLIAEGNVYCAKIAQNIEQYCTGNYDLFAYHTNVDVDSRILTFNIKHLPTNVKEVAMKVCLSLVWSKLVQNWENNKKIEKFRCTWVYLDEFHLFFDSFSTVNTLKQYWKRCRKYAGIMTGITQSVSDLIDTKYGQAIVDSTGFKIFMRQSAISMRVMQQIWDIPDCLIDYVHETKPQGTGILQTSKATIPFDYRLPDTTQLHLLMSTKPADMAKIGIIEQETSMDNFFDLGLDDELVDKEEKSDNEDEDILLSF